MRRIVFAVFCFLAVPSGASSAEAQISKPYEYRLILRIAPHRLLTPTFRRHLRNELQDGVQAALGALAQVDVIDADAPQSKDWLDPTTLDTHSEVGPAKRHFVDVSFADGRYVVRARQLDGSTGLAGPVVREARTADRAFVGRLITRFIEQDFGVVGTVIGFDKTTDRATLAFRASALAPAKLARLTPAGSVFALARIQGSPARGRQVDAAYLVTLAEPKDGQCECRIVYRYQDQLADSATVTYRALKLGATQGPIRLRLVDQTGLPPAGLQVLISSDGFQSKAVRDQGAVRDGAFDSAQSYDRMAYVVVTSGDAKVAQVPVPVIDDRVTTCRVTTAPNGEARQQIELDARNAQQRLLDIYRRLTNQNGRLVGIIRAQQNQEALDGVKKSLDLLDGELPSLTAEIARLRKQTTRIESTAGKVLDQCDVFAKQVRQRREALVGWQSKLEEAIKDEKKQEPERVGFLAMLNRADAQKEAAEFDEALKTYDEMLNRFGEREDIRKRKEKLEEDWKIKSDEHRRAREFVYGAWASVRTVDDVKANLPKARAALETCKQVDDRLTPLKLLLAAPVDVMSKAVEEIEKSDSDVDKLNLPILQGLNDELRTLIKDVSAYVRAEKS